MDDRVCAHRPPVAVIARFAVSGIASAKPTSPNMGIVGILLTFQLDQPSINPILDLNSHQPIEPLTRGAR